MTTAHEPATVTGDEVTFRLTTEGPEDLLLVDFDHNRHGRRNLSLTEEQVSALEPYTLPEADSFLDPAIDRDSVEFAVVFDYDGPPAHRRHDRTAIFDYGEGKLFVRLPDGEDFEFGICPLLAKHIDEQAQ